MKNICIIGCGNIGSRHLQALIKIPFPINIEIVEPLLKSQELAKQRLSEVQFNKELHKISWKKNIEELHEKSDLVIVSTISVGRVDLICKLLEMGHTRFLIEKIVCQSDEEYEKLIKRIKEFNAKGWVNTNRRYFQTYKKLKEYFMDSKMIHVSVTSSNVSALATNAIHFLDFFSYFTNSYRYKSKWRISSK